MSSLTETVGRISLWEGYH